MTNFNVDESLIEQYRAEFEETHCVFFPGLLKKNVLQNLLNKLDKINFLTKFEMDEKNKFGKVLFVPVNDPILFTFQLMFNNKELFSILEKITDCGPIGNFIGRMHRSEKDEHEIKWHDDNTDTRLLAMTLGLDTERYTGAEFQMREKSTQKITRELGQIEAGDAIIFKIDPALEHRLAPMESGRRTVGVGWFRGAPDYDTFVKTYLKPF